MASRSSSRHGGSSSNGNGITVASSSSSAATSGPQGVGWLARDNDSPSDALVLSLPLGRLAYLPCYQAISSPSSFVILVVIGVLVDDGREQRLRLTVSDNDSNDVKIEVVNSLTQTRAPVLININNYDMAFHLMDCLG
jgi:hypothetical protein